MDAAAMAAQALTNICTVLVQWRFSAFSAESLSDKGIISMEIYPSQWLQFLTLKLSAPFHYGRANHANG